MPRPSLIDGSLAEAADALAARAVAVRGRPPSAYGRIKLAQTDFLKSLGDTKLMKALGDDPVVRNAVIGGLAGGTIGAGTHLVGGRPGRRGRGLLGSALFGGLAGTALGGGIGLAQKELGGPLGGDKAGGKPNVRVFRDPQTGQRRQISLEGMTPAQLAEAEEMLKPAPWYHQLATGLGGGIWNFWGENAPYSRVGVPLALAAEWAHRSPKLMLGEVRPFAALGRGVENLTETMQNQRIRNIGRWIRDQTHKMYLPGRVRPEMSTAMEDLRTGVREAVESGGKKATPGGTAIRDYPRKALTTLLKSEQMMRDLVRERLVPRLEKPVEEGRAFFRSVATRKGKPVTLTEPSARIAGEEVPRALERELTARGFFSRAKQKGIESAIPMRGVGGSVEARAAGLGAGGKMRLGGILVSPLVEYVIKELGAERRRGEQLHEFMRRRSVPVEE